MWKNQGIFHSLVFSAIGDRGFFYAFLYADTVKGYKTETIFSANNESRIQGCSALQCGTWVVFQPPLD